MKSPALRSSICLSSNARRHPLASPAAVARAGGPGGDARLSPAIIAANGDALSHALESYTARPHSAKAKNYEGFDGANDPMNQGANLCRATWVRARHCA